jgi:hypothetical protein
MQPMQLTKSFQTICARRWDMPRSKYAKVLCILCVEWGSRWRRLDISEDHEELHVRSQTLRTAHQQQV